MAALEELLKKFEDIQREMRAMNQRNEKPMKRTLRGWIHIKRH